MHENPIFTFGTQNPKFSVDLSEWRYLHGSELGDFLAQPYEACHSCSQLMLLVAIERLQNSFWSFSAKVLAILGFVSVLLSMTI